MKTDEALIRHMPDLTPPAGRGSPMSGGEFALPERVTPFWAN